MKLSQPSLSVELFFQSNILHSSNQPANNSTNDSWVYLWSIFLWFLTQDTFWDPICIHSIHMANPFQSIIPVHTYSMYEDKVKSSSLAYNRRETRDKRPLGRDSDRSWCHLHTSVNCFGRSSWIHELSGSTFVCCHRCLWSHGLRA
jgi:hypothetical protein